MKMRGEKRLIVAVIAAVGLLGGAAAGLAEGQTADAAGGQRAPRRPAGRGWDGQPSHPIEPGHPDMGHPGRPAKPNWHRWRHPPDGEGRQGPRSEMGWFQRPYPYHLDYYRMRYGGSYEPYFGNISGPPIIHSPWFGFTPFALGWGGAYYW